MGNNNNMGELARKLPPGHLAQLQSRPSTNGRLALVNKQSTRPDLDNSPRRKVFYGFSQLLAEAHPSIERYDVGLKDFNGLPYDTKPIEEWLFPYHGQTDPP